MHEFFSSTSKIFELKELLKDTLVPLDNIIVDFDKNFCPILFIFCKNDTYKDLSILLHDCSLFFGEEDNSIEKFKYVIDAQNKTVKVMPSNISNFMKILIDLKSINEKNSDQIIKFINQKIKDFKKLKPINKKILSEKTPLLSNY